MTGDILVRYFYATYTRASSWHLCAHNQLGLKSLAAARGSTDSLLLGVQVTEGDAVHRELGNHCVRDSKSVFEPCEVLRVRRLTSPWIRAPDE